MTSRTFPARVLAPVSWVLAPLGVSWFVYFQSAAIEDAALHRWIAGVSGAVLLWGVCAGSTVIYSLAYFRGASPRERVLACFVIPLVYVVYEIVAVSEAFSLAESLYYGLNPTVWMLSLLTVLLMGTSEWFCRGLRRLRGEALHVFNRPPLAAIAIALVGGYFSLIWGKGTHLFYLYVDGYLALFAGG